jgi:hypothetical protein
MIADVIFGIVLSGLIYTVIGLAVGFTIEENYKKFRGKHHTVFAIGMLWPLLLAGIGICLIGALICYVVGWPYFIWKEWRTSEGSLEEHT